MSSSSVTMTSNGVRFIVDMRRSGEHGLTTSPGRIVLPTPTQVMSDTRRLLPQSRGEVEFLKADFTDAYLSVGVATEEHGYVVVTDEAQPRPSRPLWGTRAAPMRRR